MVGRTWILLLVCKDFDNEGTIPVEADVPGWILDFLGGGPWGMGKAGDPFAALALPWR